MANVMVLEGRAFGRWLGEEGGVFMNGIGAFIKETPLGSLDPSTMWVYDKVETWTRALTWPGGDHPAHGIL